MSANYKIIAIFAVLLVATAGCIGHDPKVEEAMKSSMRVTTSPVPTPTPLPEYVLCSDYYHITDRYKTPAGFYIVADNITISLTEGQYLNTTMGGYAKIEIDSYTTYSVRFSYSYEPTYHIVDSIKGLVPVTEKESGYRLACRAIRG
jgi:hypothetical protein